VPPGSVAEWILRSALCDVVIGRPGRFTFALPWAGAPEPSTCSCCSGRTSS